MSWTFGQTFVLGPGKSGLTLNAAFVNRSDGSLALKDVALTVGLIGGNYYLETSSVPDGFRGRIALYTGTVGSGTNLSGVTVIFEAGDLGAEDEAGAKIGNGAAGGLAVVNSAGNVPADLQTVKTQTVTATGAFSFDAQTTAQAEIGSINTNVSGLSNEVTNLPVNVWANASRTLTSLGSTAPAGWLNSAAFGSDVLPANFGTLTIVANQAIGTSNYAGGAVPVSGTVTVGGYAANEDPATILVNATAYLSAVAAATVSQLGNNSDNGAVTQAIVNAINNADPSLENLTTTAIAQAVANYLLSGATTPGTLGYAVGQMLGKLPAGSLGDATATSQTSILNAIAALPTASTIAAQVLSGFGSAYGDGGGHLYGVLVGAQATELGSAATSAASAASAAATAAASASSAASSAATAATNTGSLPAMIQGDAFTAPALANAPAGGAGSSLTPQQLRDAMNLAPSGSAATKNSGSVAAVGDISLAGPGASACTLQFTNSATGLPIVGAKVWVTLDSAGTSVYAGTLTTDSNGKAKFYLTAGDQYYVWMVADGETPITGKLFTAIAD